MSESTRAYIYRVLVVLVPVLGFYGLAQDGEAELWLTVASVVLGTTGGLLATANTSTKSNNP
jgi:hypothetical protein